MIILGIDPGSLSCGFSIIKKDGSRIFLLEAAALTLTSGAPFPERLLIIHDFFQTKIQDYGVTDLALETPFLGKNAQNFLKLGYVRGILYLLVQRNKLGLHEFAPCQIKRALTGSGAADKELVSRMVMRLFPGFQQPSKLDVTDALAVALCSAWLPSPVVR